MKLRFLRGRAPGRKLQARVGMFERVGVVIIGRNEGQRLHRCLRSVLRDTSRVVYVDSGSEDGSASFARSVGAEVVELDLSLPFTAARARNAGLARLCELHAEVDVVQFVDGDCELANGWLGCAERTLAERRDCAAVCGRLRERFPEHSIFNRLCDLEWNTPVGDVDSCGGIAMYRVADFAEAGGFDPTIAAGEEPELCARLRSRGRRVCRIDADMALHDAAMLRFSQWWRRQVRGGYGALDVATRFESGRGGGSFSRQVRSARIWTIGWGSVHVLATAGVAAAWGWTAAVIAFAAVACAVPAQALRIASQARRKGASPRLALAHGLLAILGKWAQLRGQLRYACDRASGRAFRLIEHKDAMPSGSPASAPLLEAVK